MVNTEALKNLDNPCKRKSAIEAFNMAVSSLLRTLKYNAYKIAHLQGDIEDGDFFKIQEGFVGQEKELTDDLQDKIFLFLSLGSKEYSAYELSLFFDIHESTAHSLLASYKKNKAKD